MVLMQAGGRERGVLPGVAGTRIAGHQGETEAPSHTSTPGARPCKIMTVINDTWSNFDRTIKRTSVDHPFRRS